MWNGTHRNMRAIDRPELKITAVGPSTVLVLRYPLRVNIVNSLDTPSRNHWF